MQLNNLIKYKSCITVQFPTFAGTNWITCMKSDEDTVSFDGWKVIVGGGNVKADSLDRYFGIVKAGYIAFFSSKSYICVTKMFFESMQNKTIGWISLVSKPLPIICK